MKNHIYSTTAQIIEKLMIRICDENTGTDDVLISHEKFHWTHPTMRSFWKSSSFTILMPHTNHQST